MRLDKDMSILLCFQETSSESDSQFSPESLMRLRWVLRGGRRRWGAGWASSKRPGRALQKGASRRALDPARLALDSQVPRLPRPQSLLGLTGALGSPTDLSLRVPPPFAAPSLGWLFFLLLRTELRRTEQFALLFPLHAPVLKPDLDLPLGQAQGVRDLYAPPAGQVAIIVKFLLQL